MNFLTVCLEVTSSSNESLGGCEWSGWLWHIPARPLELWLPVDTCWLQRQTTQRRRRRRPQCDGHCLSAFSLILSAQTQVQSRTWPFKCSGKITARIYTKMTGTSPSEATASQRNANKSPNGWARPWAHVWLMWSLQLKTCQSSETARESLDNWDAHF